MTSDEVAARLGTIVESSDDGIIGKTLDGVIISWNPAAERIFGYSPAEAIGQHITLILPEERRHEEGDVIARLPRGEVIDQFETVRVTKGGGVADALEQNETQVRDAGPGIPAEVLPRIFDPFFTTIPEGNGLGLAISYGIVRDHDGTIDVESTPGQGTTFALTFPALGTEGFR